ncbi:hypothetical protein AMECASPLE_014870 [Ameca splendens]|uniref:Uncharacterized protein n=1 Tax=Ameca splendens TaxID=208324 RepID=A0ABV0Z031_9TELE
MAPHFHPWGQRWSKVKEILIPLLNEPRAAKHKPNSSHNALELANLDSLPQRSASILNGNYCTQTHMHTQHLDRSNEMQKTKRRKGGIVGKSENKMTCSKKKIERMKQTRKKGCTGKVEICKCEVREFRWREEV